MERLKLDYPAQHPVPQRVHVGVVASGDLEVLLEPSADGRAHVVVNTSVDGFGATWKSVLDRIGAPRRRPQRPLAEVTAWAEATAWRD